MFPSRNTSLLLNLFDLRRLWFALCSTHTWCDRVVPIQLLTVINYFFLSKQTKPKNNEQPSRCPLDFLLLLLSFFLLAIDCSINLDVQISFGWQQIKMLKYKLQLLPKRREFQKFSMLTDMSKLFYKCWHS